MEFEKIIKRQRETYLRQLTKFFSERTTGAREILIELNGDEKEIFKLCRLDYLEQIDGQPRPTELAPDIYLNYEPIIYKFGQLNVELSPFYWHGCEFVLDKELKDIDWLKKWITKWIDEDDKNQTDINGFSGVIHSVTRPINKNNKFIFSVDFGTASEESLVELVHMIERLGHAKLKIGSFEMIE